VQTDAERLAMSDEQFKREWLRRIQSEFFEMPGLRLTRPQAQRLWALDAQLCGTLLDALVSARVLEKTTRDVYVLASTTGG
jgi:hypothetical protein